jgi:hypothetical protein
VNTIDECFRISTTCRLILRDPQYSPRVSAQLIEWLNHPNAAVSDIAGRCLLKLGPSAFSDLFAVVSSTSPWPNAVWVLSEFGLESHRLLPSLRSWLTEASGDLERQCAVSLANLLVARKDNGYPLDVSDVELCLRLLNSFAQESPGMKLRLREFTSALGTA